MSKHRKRSLAHDAVYAREAVTDWFARADADTVAFFQNWKDMTWQMGASWATLPQDISTEALVDQLGRITAHSETFYITSDIAGLVQEASQDMPPHSLRREDVPSPSGWLYFEEPIEFIATDGVASKVRAIMWQQRDVGDPVRGQPGGLPGMVIWHFTDVNDMEPGGENILRSGLEGATANMEAMKNVFRGKTPMMPTTFGVIANGRIPWVAQRINSDNTYLHGDISWVAKNPWLEEAFRAFYRQETWADDDAPIPPGEVEKDGSEDGRWIVRTPDGTRMIIQPDHGDRWLLAFFRFLQQKLPEITREPVAKSVAKSLRNKGIPSGPITVVTWRKRMSSHETGTGRALTYRHIRRGHWRRQWHGPRDARYMVPTYIAPSIIGDESLPLRIREVANAVVR